jgi:predicted transcriptional regulator
VTAIQIELSDDIARELSDLAVAQKRSETEIVREALAAYVRTARPMPKGMGQYQSGTADTSERARDILRQATKDNRWP